LYLQTSMQGDGTDFDDFPMVEHGSDTKLAGGKRMLQPVAVTVPAFGRIDPAKGYSLLVIDHHGEPAGPAGEQVSAVIAWLSRRPWR
jgi:hypothetical protein